MQVKAFLLEKSVIEKIALYEKLKSAWISRNPEASPQQYEAAMWAIAKQCGA
jgi:hypothetical protein